MKKIAYNKKKLVFWILLLLGVAVRIAAFGKVPNGLNQDEAFAGYEAYSLAYYGVDSFGFHNPIYLTTWGSGMNALESYLMVPFIRLLGCTETAVRLPQLICACATLPIFYLLLKRLFSVQVALIGLALLAVSPWHIMLSRWALESNIAPFFLILGFYGFVRGMDDARFWLLSALGYGLSLYAYALTWLTVPFTLLLCGGYFLLAGEKHPSWRHTLGAAALLFVMAFPLILFLLVNYGVIPQIETSWFSIPKLIKMRSGEMSIKNLFSPDSYKNLLRMLWKQNDGQIWNATEQFGIFYHIGLPFVFIGFIRMAMDAAVKVKKKTFSTDLLVLLALTASILICLLSNEININRANAIYLYLLILQVRGVQSVIKICSKAWLVKGALFCGYAVSFCLFCVYYFGSYNSEIARLFRAGVGDAVRYAKSLTSQTIYVDSSVYHSQVMFYDETPAELYRETVQYVNYPSEYLSAKSFSRYQFGFDENALDSQGVYILQKEKAETFTAAGYHITEFGCYAVAWM